MNDDGSPSGSPSSHHGDHSSLRARIKQVFRRYDRSGDGFLDEQEVRRVLKALTGESSPEDAFHLCTDLARTKPGKVCCKEFTDWVLSGAAGRDVVRAILRETGEKREARIREAFQRYDKSGDGTLDISELRQVLRALGSFTNHEVELVCADLDTNKDGEVSQDEFKAWINKGGGDGVVVKAKAILAPSDDNGVEGVFYIFCGAERSEMDGKSFVKFCKDCNLVDKKLTETTVDLIFSSTKVKAKGHRFIDFEQFEVALEHICERKGMSMDEMHEKVLKVTAPMLHGTKPDNVRFHDDFSNPLLKDSTQRAALAAAAAVAGAAAGILPRMDASQRMPNLIKSRTETNLAEEGRKIRRQRRKQADNEDTWKHFGLHTKAGRHLKLLYEKERARCTLPMLGERGCRTGAPWESPFLKYRQRHDTFMERKNSGTDEDLLRGRLQPLTKQESLLALMDG